MKQLKNEIILLSILMIVLKVASQSNVINIECSTFGKKSFYRIDGDVGTCISSKNMKTSDFDYETSEFFFNNQSALNVEQKTRIEALCIKNATDLKYLPSGIGKHLLSLKVFEVEYSGLTHLDEYDMKQFGSKILRVRFAYNALTALSGDLFKHNINLIYVNFENNHFKYIDSNLFKNFSNINKNLRFIAFSYCDCMNTTFSSNVTLKLPSDLKNNCTDVSEKDQQTCRTRIKTTRSDKSLSNILFWCLTNELLLRSNPEEISKIYETFQGSKTDEIQNELKLLKDKINSFLEAGVHL